MNNNIIKKQIEGLERLYNFFNNELFESGLPSIALTIQSKGRKNALGWCTIGEAWKVNDDGSKDGYYEINLSAEFMDRGVADISETLIHEMVHLSNICSGVIDCNPKTQNHNSKFKELAEKVGLKVERDGKRGWSLTTLEEELRCKILDFSSSDDLLSSDIFNVARINPNDPNKPKKDSKPKIIYSCPNCNIQFKSTKNLNIVCGNCDEDFLKVEG